MELTFDTQKLTVAHIDEIIDILTEVKSNYLLSRSVCSVFESFEALAPDLYKSKNGKKILKEYVQSVKNNTNLKKIYSLSESIYHTKKGTEATFFLNETLSLCNGVNLDKYNKGEESLRNLLNKAINEVGYKKASILLEGLSHNSEVDGCIRYLASTKKDLKNLSEFSYHFNTVAKFITENAGTNVREKKEKSILPLDEVVNEFNASCAGLSKKDRTLVSEIVNTNDKSVVFEKYKGACLDAINEAISKNENHIDCDRLVDIKGKIENKTYNPTSLGSDVLNFIELQSLIKE